MTSFARHLRRFAPIAVCAALACPTAEQLDQLATAIELGLPLDPALVLPTPDAQAIFT